MQFGDEIGELKNNRADKQGTNAAHNRGQSEGSVGPRLKNKQGAEYEAGTPMHQVGSRLMLPQMPVRF